VTLCLEHLKIQGVDLMNIDASDVVSGNKNVILGLVWRVMLHSFALDLGVKNQVWHVMPMLPVESLTIT
jgi:hypothetical protein